MVEIFESNEWEAKLTELLKDQQMQPVKCSKVIDKTSWFCYKCLDC